MYLKLVSSGEQVLPSVDLLPGRAAVRDPSCARPLLTVEYKPEISEQIEITCVARTKVVLIQREGSDAFEVLTRGHITRLCIGDEVVIVDKQPVDSPYELPDDPQVSYILAVSNEVCEGEPQSASKCASLCPSAHATPRFCAKGPQTWDRVPSRGLDRGIKNGPRMMR